MILLDAVTETVTEAVTEALTGTAAETETATEAVNYTMPDGIDVTKMVPGQTMVAELIAAIAILGVMILMIFYMRKKWKGTLFSFIGGIASYLIFFYFGWRVVYYLFYIPAIQAQASNVGLLITLFTIIPAVIGMMGRVLCLKLLSSTGDKTSIHITVALGLVSALAIYVSVNTFFDFVNCYYINENGFESAVAAVTSSCTSQAEFDSSVTQLYSYTSATPWDYIIRGLDNIMVMFYQLAVTFPIMAAYQDKESKIWYLYGVGTYAIILLAKNLYSYSVIPGAVSVIIEAVVLAATIYFARRIYKDYYRDEEPEEKPKDQEPPQKKMPKFGNLSEL